jgi:cytochrome c556
MKVAQLGLAGAALAMVVGFALAEPDEGAPKTERAAFMRLKLKASQEVLEGIALEDFAKIRKNAQALSLMTEDEIWHVLQTPDYLRLSNEFRRSADEVANAAEAKNLDRATLAYMEMTMKCVSCHRHIRAEQMAAWGRNRLR